MQVKHLVVLLILAAFAIGCGGQPGVRGKVTFSDDKTPLTQGTINFESDKNIARGEVDGEGNYVIGSLKANDGLPPGQYRVYFTGTEKYKTSPTGGLVGIENVIDQKYNKAETSGLTVEVKKSMTFDIEVDRYNAGGAQKKR